jgi:hypothetical protein
MASSNLWAELAATYLRTRSAHQDHEIAKAELKKLIPEDAQPCLICQQIPSDPHHLKFAQPKALGRKVSDEFTVPLCRAHHQDLHRHGNEKAWWANMQIEPMSIAKQLWDASQSVGQESAAVLTTAAHTTMSERIST